MHHNYRINTIHGREILDSRGNPTVEVEVKLCSGHVACASVPSGASTGAYEAVELRDPELPRYRGQGVKKAIEYVNDTLNYLLEGKDARDQARLDEIMIREDGTKNKSHLGANAILGASMAIAKAAACTAGLPLYKYFGGAHAGVMPVPMMNIINGGKHADSSLTIQEFMIMPVGAHSFHQCLEWSVNVYHTLQSILHGEGYQTAVGDEGGYAPQLKNDEEALSYIVKAIETAGYTPDRDIRIAMDGAATEMYEAALQNGHKGEYYFWKSGQYKTSDEMIDYWSELCGRYPICSIEDGLSEEDWQGWRCLTDRLGDSIQLVGDDLFVTNTERIRKGIDEGAGNAVLIKPNQIGTMTETLKAIRMTQCNGWQAIVSHRSGETEDTTIADLAVGLGVGQIKAGAPARTDRVAKYNQLLRIEEELGDSAIFGRH